MVKYHVLDTIPSGKQHDKTTQKKKRKYQKYSIHTFRMISDNLGHIPDLGEITVSQDPRNTNNYTEILSEFQRTLLQYT